MDDEYKQILGKVMAEKRMRAGLNKSQLGLISGVDRATVRLVETGEGNPTTITLLRLAQAVGASLADIFVETERLLSGKSNDYPPIPESIQFDGGTSANTYFITRF